MEVANNHSVLKRNERFPAFILLREKKKAKQSSCCAFNTKDKISMHRL